MIDNSMIGRVFYIMPKNRWKFDSGYYMIVGFAKSDYDNSLLYLLDHPVNSRFFPERKLNPYYVEGQSSSDIIILP